MGCGDSYDNVTQIEEDAQISELPAQDGATVNKFFIVMTDEYALRATYRHGEEEEAKIEAKRLSQVLNKRMFVLGVIGAYEPPLWKPAA